MVDSIIGMENIFQLSTMYAHIVKNVSKNVPGTMYIVHNIINSMYYNIIILLFKKIINKHVCSVCIILNSTTY